MNYREAYGFHASNGILFNHEGPRRGETFVTRKITRAVAAIAQGNRTGSISAISMPRAIGAMQGLCAGMWLMLQQPEGDDYVLATGESHSVREFVEQAFDHIGRKIVWRGKGIDETGIDAKTAEILVRIDPCYFRPTEVDRLLGDPGKAHQRLGWRAEIGFREIVREMVEADLQRIEDARSFRHE